MVTVYLIMAVKKRSFKPSRRALSGKPLTDDEIQDGKPMAHEHSPWSCFPGAAGQRALGPRGFVLLLSFSCQSSPFVEVLKIREKRARNLD